MLFRNKSIKVRLMIMIMSVAVVAVGVTMLAMSMIGVYNLKQALIEEIELAATIVGERNKFSIQLGHQAQVTSNLEIFKVRPSVMRACIYDRHGNIFAFYPMPSASFNGFINSESGFRAMAQCPLFHGELTRSGDMGIETFRYIMLGDEKQGSIYVESDLRRVHQYIHSKLYTALFVIMFVFALSWLMAWRLQREISEPMRELAHVATRVSKYRDYSYRVLGKKSQHDIGKYYSSEVSTLIGAFNTMLSDIGTHEASLRQHYIELENAKEAAESASMAKSMFLASISHELRTPLNAIIGFSTIINSQLFGVVNEKYLEYSGDIHDSGVHLLEVINDILDLSKAESGHLTLHFEAFSPNRVLNKVIKILAVAAEKAEVQIKLDAAQGMPALIADRVRVTQIILNIASNAIKFTGKGGCVMLRAYAKKEEDGNMLFYMTIKDDGIGMTKAEIATAFQAFGQIDDGLNRKYEGTGLGLPLSKKLIDLHQGSIFVESEPGKGTKVRVVIPSQRPENAE